MKKKFALILGLVMMLSMVFALPVVAAEDEKGWLLTDIEMPANLSNFACTEAEGKIYFFGGPYASDSIYVYDTQSKTWGPKANMPFGLYQPTASYFNGKIYLFGGTNNPGSIGNLIVQEYDILTDTWTSKNRNSEVGTVINPAVALVDGIFYVCGGLSHSAGGYGGTYDYLYTYNPTTDTWAKKADMISPSHGGNRLIDYNGELYFFGEVSQKYNILKDEWQIISQMPERIPPSIVRHENDVYILGLYDDRGGGAKDSVYKYSLSTDTYEKIASLPISIGRGGAELIDGKIYFFGDNFGATPQNTIYVYDVANSDTRLYVLLDVAEQAQLSVTHSLADNATLTWTSTDPAVATVDAAGKVTAISEGTCLIYARNSDGSFVDYIPVKVLASGAADEYRLALHLNVGESKRLWITDDYANVTWSSMDPATATVDSAGRVTGVARGLCLVQGEYDGQVYTIYVRVS